jgi:hypothetical protein
MASACDCCTEALTTASSPGIHSSFSSQKPEDVPAKAPPPLLHQAADSSTHFSYQNLLCQRHRGGRSPPPSSLSQPAPPPLTLCCRRAYAAHGDVSRLTSSSHLLRSIIRSLLGASSQSRTTVMAAPLPPPSLNPCACLYALSGRTEPLLVSSLSSIDRIRTHTLSMASQQPVARELRRAIINGVLWLEMVCLPPHAMAGSKYYASQVPPLPSIFAAPASAPSLSPQGQAPTPIKPALFDTSVDIAAHSATSAVAPKAAAAETQEHAKQRLAAATAKLQAAQDAKAASAQKLAEAQKEDDLAA